MKNPYVLAQNILSTTDNASAPFTSMELYGVSAQKAEAADGLCRRFHLENESGTGDVTLYRVFPGIELAYNDMHMAYCNQQQQPMPHIMEINYCKEGRSECLFEPHQYCYMAAGDLSFCSLHDQAHQSEFPTSHYHGITVTLDFSAVTDEMRAVLTMLCVDLERIRALSQSRDFTIIRANSTIEHIFSELYQVPAAIRYGYIRVKMVELLLVLTELDPSAEPLPPIRFSAAQIETVKKIHAFLIEHFQEHHTIAELSERFQLSPTVLKKCFRSIYGDSIYSYRKRFRL